MSKSFSLRFLIVALFSCSAWAQGIQNRDIFVSAGPSWNQPQTIGGTNVMLAGSSGFNLQEDFGYQVARAGATSLLVDVSFIFSEAGALRANVPTIGRSNFSPITAGLRLMVPVHPRLSLYAVSGGGFVNPNSPVIAAGASPSVSTDETYHGVFAFGGGADVRLSKWWSLRAEVRDLVTGKDLAGVTGRHHVVPLFGVGFHF